MSIYIFTLVVLLIFSFLELRTNLLDIQHKAMAIFVFCLFVFQVGLRWQTGTDWEPYLQHFEEVNSIFDVYNSLTGFEKGYSFFVLITKLFWNNYSVFLFAHALIYYFLIFSAFKKLTPYFFVSLLVFYASTMGIMGSNRQLIALGICLFSLRYMLNKSTLKFFLLIGLAFLFHRSAILFIVYYFINIDIKKSLLFIILIISFIIGKTNLPIVAFSFAGSFIGDIGTYKTMFYSVDYQENAASLSILGLIKRLLFFGLFLYNYNFLTTKLPYYKLIFNGYFIGLVIYTLFSSSLLILVNRGSLYFSVMEGVLIASQFILLKDKHYTVNFLILLFIVSYFLFFQSIGGYPDLFIPYKGIFINSDVFRYRLQ
jgi:hypothetical protein